MLTTTLWVSLGSEVVNWTEFLERVQVADEGQFVNAILVMVCGLPVWWNITTYDWDWPWVMLAVSGVTEMLKSCCCGWLLTVHELLHVAGQGPFWASPLSHASPLADSIMPLPQRITLQLLPVPTHTPLLQASLLVQLFPSLQAAPLFAPTLQAPQVESFWQVFTPAHGPLPQPCVEVWPGVQMHPWVSTEGPVHVGEPHALLEPWHVRVRVWTPATHELHELQPDQVPGLPVLTPEQEPLEHTSPVVQLLPSEHEALLLEA